MLKLTELISVEIADIKYSGDQRLPPDVPFSRTFSPMTCSPYRYFAYMGNCHPHM